MEKLLIDIGYAYRRMLAQKWSTLTIILTIAIGIGSNTAIFSIVNGVLLKDLPFEKGEDLIVIKQSIMAAPDKENIFFSVPEINDYRDQSETLAQLSEYHSMKFTMHENGEPTQINAGVVSANYFNLLGINPILGRSLQLADDELGSEPIIILSYQFWQRKFNSDINVINRTVEMNDKIHRIIGVMPAFPEYPRVNDIYIPVSVCPTRSSENVIHNRNKRMMHVFGKVKDNVSINQARTELKTIANRIHKANPAYYPENYGFIILADKLIEVLTKDIKPSLYIMMSITFLVLLISCSNVTNLILAQQSVRQKELAVREAVGATKERLIRQLLTESILLFLIGGVLGLFIAIISFDALISYSATLTTRASDISLDSTVLLFTFAISVIGGIISGLLPALSKKKLAIVMKESGHHASGSGKSNLIRACLIVTQFIISFILLYSAILMLKSLNNIKNVDPGFNSKNVSIMQIELNWAKYSKGDQINSFANQLLINANNLPFVSYSSISSTYPMSANGIKKAKLLLNDRATLEQDNLPVVDYRAVDQHYFNLLDITLLKGRMFSKNDDALSSPVAVINRSMAESLWADSEPMQIKLSLDDGESWHTIVGIVDNVKQHGLDKVTPHAVYLPYAQVPNNTIQLLIKKQGKPKAIAKTLREIVYKIDSKQPVTSIKSMQAILESNSASPRLITFLLSIFGGFAIILTISGIAGIIAYSAQQRQVELGIRSSIGAEPKNLIWLVIKQGLIMSSIGIVLGIICTIYVSRLMEGIVFGVDVISIGGFVLTIFVLFAIALIASIVPAFKISYLTPSALLRK
ncbi:MULTISPECIES: ABC transporter permease [unclassified Colwellia]|uniref:ABC transporter permease n=1 Tax=unclassified Colwellia TaxID=196834 RepID=UPI0015F5C6CB|nr:MULTISPECIES: ABC transporter permease [unclassified Colwellia]MBA6257677.1 ABC transporter permease [Colwellia sp. MB3u-28]MBA6259434.1 ABC transporter permease [Colwellia sp. MB3u-41]MBA6304363.1 ABC transporter permease [Colwellia sp. MB02u-14]